MKTVLRVLIIFVLMAAAVGGLVFAYLEMREERDKEATAEAAVTAGSHVERDKDGGPVLKMNSETQQRLGIKVAVPAMGSVKSKVPASVRVLEGAALAVQLNEVRSAESALEVAKADYERKNRLFQNGKNASASAVEAAEGLVQQQQLALENARDRIAAAWGQAIAGRTNLPALARDLLRREAALVRVDLLGTAKLPLKPETVHLLQANGEEAGSAQLLGPAPMTDSVVSGQSFLCLVTTNAGALVPGAVLQAQLDSGAAEHGAVLPHAAVVRHSGLGWAYEQTGPETFTRREVPLDKPHPAGWLVPGDWKKPVAMSGAQSLLSEELKGSIQMRD